MNKKLIAELVEIRKDLEQEINNLKRIGNAFDTVINKIEYDGKHAFVITPKGRQYLESYKTFSDIAGSFGLDL